MRFNKILFIVLLSVPFLGLSKHPVDADTSTTKYVSAVNNWLFGNDSLAKLQLLAIPARLGSTEHILARGLLLDEYYFWPGQHQRYLQLSDSLHVVTSFYSAAKILAQQPPVQYLMQADSLVFPINLKHRTYPVVEVRINGKVCRLIVDTGAQGTVLSRRFARHLGIEKLANLELNNYDSQIVLGSLMMADLLVLGGLTIKNLPVSVAQIPFLGIDGLLGWDIMRHFVVKIDYGHRKLTLYRSKPKPVARKSLLGGSRPVLLMYGPNNNQLNIMIDTGDNRKFSVSPTGLAKIGPYQMKSRLTFSQAIGRLIRISRQQFVKHLTVRIDAKSYSFRNSAIFRNEDVIGLIIRDGLIGSGAFRNGQLTLDAFNHWFEYKSFLKERP